MLDKIKIIIKNLGEIAEIITETALKVGTAIAVIKMVIDSIN